MKNKSWYDIKNVGKKTAEISIYDEIGFFGITAKQFIDDLKAIKSAKDITLRINSPGGNITDGNAIYNALKNIKGNLIVQIDSLAASMATVISMSGAPIRMASNGLYMIHNPRGGAYGESKDLKTIADVMDKMKTNIVNVYTSKTGKSDDEISDMMDDVTWMTAQEALDEGFIDEITDEVEVVNNFDLSKLEKVPEQLLEINNFKSIDTETAMETDVSTSGNVAGILKEEVKMTKEVKKETMPQDTDPLAVDKDAIKAEAKLEFAKAESKRKDGIKVVFERFKDTHGDLMNKCLDDMDCNAESARVQLLDEMGKGEKPVVGTSNIIVVEDSRDKLREGLTNAISVRANMAKDDLSNEYRGYKLYEIARLLLEKAGKSTRGMGQLDIVAAAFTHTTSDFSTILSSTANKSMLRGYEEADETFQLWTNVGTLTDFKATTRVDLNTMPALAEVPEGAEYTYGTVADRGETVQLVTYGKLFSITRQAIINDDLRAFTEVPRKMGRAAVRTVGNLAYSVITTNADMSDGVDLFHADHSNLAGSGAAPSTATFDAARTAMAKQTDATGTTLNIRPSYVLVPEALRSSAMVVNNSETQITATQQANSKVPNTVRGMVEVIADARLDANSATAWYMLANRTVTDTVEISYLDGVQSPVLEQQSGWNIDGVEFKVRIDAAAKALDYRTMYKNAGA